MLRRSEYNIYIPVEEFHEVILIHGYTGALDVIEEPLYNLFVADDFQALDKELLNSMLQRGYLTEKNHAEERDVVIQYAQIMKNKRKKVNSFLFIPTYNCNLRCKYCYQSLFKTKSKQWLETVMTEQLVDKAYKVILDQIAAQEKDEEKKVPFITLYGGEPFLEENKPIIRYILARGREYDFKFHVITNGVELKHYNDILAENQITSVKITIDGFRETHDKRRFMKGGAPSFDKIIASLDAVFETIKKNNIEVVVRINVNKENIGDIKHLFAFFKEKGYTSYPGFRYYSGLILSNIITDRYEDLSVTEYKDFAETDEVLKQPALSRQVNFDTRGQFYRIFKEGGLPQYKIGFCGANQGMLVFDPFGNLYSCWDVVGYDEDIIGRYDPELQYNKEILEKWYGRSVLDIAECLDCKYALYCAGGCQRISYREQKSYLKPACRDFADVFENSVRVAYLDLKNEAKCGK